jgi:MFS family permease
VRPALTQVEDPRSLYRRPKRYSMRRVGFGLSRALWIVAFGIFLNALGYGAVLPFEIIYLHDGRGFGLGVAGLVVGTITGTAVLSGPLVGPLIDRFGARATMVGAGVALAAGYAGLAFATSPGHAFVAAALAGAGNGALNPSQSTLVATLTLPDRRHRATAVSRVAANAGYGMGGALGGLIAANGLNGFVALFILNAVTYLIYVGVVVAVVREGPRPEPVRGGYGRILRDRAFMHLALVNVAMIAVGWGVFSWLLPPFARNQIGIKSSLIGLLLLANAVTVVMAQVPIARLAEGRQRVAMMALAGLIFLGACLLMALAGAGNVTAYAALLAAAVAVGIGECFHTAALMPLVAELAPAAVRGRYMASIGFSWWVGLTVAPTLGTQLLSRAPITTFLAAAAIASLAAVGALRLKHRLPEGSRLTPRPNGGPGT